MLFHYAEAATLEAALEEERQINAIVLEELHFQL
jgi:hypothetical protein